MPKHNFILRPRIPDKARKTKRTQDIEFKNEYSHHAHGVKDNVTNTLITPQDGDKWLEYLDWLSQNSMDNPILPKFK